MFYLDIVLKSLQIAAIVTFMIIAIWGFVVFNGIYGQLKYSNYILEKISHILNIFYTEKESKKKKSCEAAVVLSEDDNDTTDVESDDIAVIDENKVSDSEEETN